MSEKENEPQNSIFGIEIEPEFKNGAWTGNVSAGMYEDLKGDLSDDEIHQIRTVCGMMASTLILMEEDPEFLDQIKEYFAERFAEYAEDDYEVDLEENKPTVFTRSSDGKVITLDFNTKTHGSA